MDLIQVLDTTVKCMGDIDVPVKLIKIVHAIITIMKFGIPLLLIIFGMLDLGKAVMASKEDEIKKGQQTFIKRLIAAIIVFFVVAVVQLVVSVVASNDGEKTGITNCLNSFINGEDCSTGTCKPLAEK